MQARYCIPTIFKILDATKKLLKISGICRVFYCFSSFFVAISLVMIFFLVTKKIESEIPTLMTSAAVCDHISPSMPQIQLKISIMGMLSAIWRMIESKNDTLPLFTAWV